MKRLTRNSREGMVLGVCAGIADYFGIDPTLVRVVWVISGLLGGVGLSKVERRNDHETTI